MTMYDLQRGNEIKEKIDEIKGNISLLHHVLQDTQGKKLFDKFFFWSNGKNKVRISSYGIAFGGELKIDRECMELIQSYYENKLAEAIAELESVGKGGEK